MRKEMQKAKCNKKLRFAYRIEISAPSSKLLLRTILTKEPTDFAMEDEPDFSDDLAYAFFAFFFAFKIGSLASGRWMALPVSAAL